MHHTLKDAPADLVNQLTVLGTQMEDIEEGGENRKTKEALSILFADGAEYYKDLYDIFGEKLAVFLPGGSEEKNNAMHML